MIGIMRRISLCLLMVAAAAPVHGALAQSSNVQGAWLEEGLSCASVFVATRNAVGFKRPASAFAPAFIISGKRLSTPLAACRLVNIKPSGDRQIVNLNCTTSISTGSATALLGLTQDGGILRYLGDEGSVATKYRRCGREDLKP
jgi:hypothetical protein